MMVRKILKVIWALPNTLLGSLLGTIGILFGGKAQFVGGALEYHGGLVAWLLRRFPNNVCAMTLGHSIVGIDQESLEAARDHEHVHVRQYERWGLFFIPAYLLSAAFMKYKGKNPYYDNPFEVEAYRIAPVNLRNDSNNSKEALCDTPGSIDVETKESQTQ